MNYSNAKSYSKKSASYEKQEASRVLLVCVYDTIALQVTNQLIYQKFSKFGSIIKVLIFDKGQVTKLFIEFYQISSAQQAKNALDGTKLLGAICKMNIYYSNFSNVDLKNETSEGADFTVHETLKNQFMNKFDNLTKSFQGDQNEILNDDYIMNAAFYQFGNRSKTDNPRRLQQEIGRINMINQNNYYYNPLSMMINQDEDIDMMIHNGINNLLQTNSNVSSEQKNNQQHTHSTNTSNERINSSLKIKDSSHVKSSVLCFQLRKDLKIKCVYNLFSNFGNISFITKKAKRIYIKFRSMQFAAIAFTYLNQYFLMGNLLKLEYPQSPNDALPKEEEFSECVFYDQTSDRYTPHRSLTVNSPSLTLHVSSIKKDICKQHVLFDIFGEYGKVQAVKILCYSNQKNMALVKFYSMEDSFQAIANLHNQMFSNRKMQISFTKSKV